MITDPRERDMPTIIIANLDLCYSPDDGEYYFHRYPDSGEEVDWETFADISQSFESKREAISANASGELSWSR